MHLRASLAQTIATKPVPDSSPLCVPYTHNDLDPMYVCITYHSFIHIHNQLKPKSFSNKKEVTAAVEKGQCAEEYTRRQYASLLSTALLPSTSPKPDVSIS